jgi:hypothetical protein
MTTAQLYRHQTIAVVYERAKRQRLRKQQCQPSFGTGTYDVEQISVPLEAVLFGCWNCDGAGHLQHFTEVVAW